MFLSYLFSVVTFIQGIFHYFDLSISMQLHYACNAWALLTLFILVLLIIIIDFDGHWSFLILNEQAFFGPRIAQRYNTTFPLSNHREFESC